MAGKSSDFFRAVLAYKAKKIGRGGQSQIAKHAGVARTHINDLLGGRTDGSDSTREKISSALGMTYEDMLSLGRWILEGKNPDEWQRHAQPGKTVVDHNVTPNERVRFGSVPLISSVQAGNWHPSNESWPPGIGERHVLVTVPVSKSAFALTVMGDSMVPEFLEGDIIVVDPDREATSGRFVVAKINGDEEVTLKRYMRDLGTDYLVPLNKDDYKRMEMTGIDWRIVGVVVQKIKEY